MLPGVCGLKGSSYSEGNKRLKFQGEALECSSSWAILFDRRYVSLQVFPSRLGNGRYQHPAARAMNIFPHANGSCPEGRVKPTPFIDNQLMGLMLKAKSLV